jgi:hypothetical protein
MFSGGMKNKWDGNIAYIEIGCGPGRCIDRRNGIEFDGTPLAVVRDAGIRAIKKALFIDNDKPVIETLNKRFTNLNLHEKAQGIEGDYANGIEVARLIRQVNPNGLRVRELHVRPVS